MLIDTGEETFQRDERQHITMPGLDPGILFIAAREEDPRVEPGGDEMRDSATRCRNRR
jgi:hypothetical protein